jgi:AraC family transcriptional regulator
MSGLTLSESLYPANLKQPRHTHSLASFSFVLAGSYLEKYGTHEPIRQSSTVIFHPPLESHAVEYSSEAVRILSVQIDSSRLSNFRDGGIAFETRQSCRNETIAWLGRRLYHEFRNSDRASALALEGLVLEILAEVSRLKIGNKETTPRWLRQAKEFLHDNFLASFGLDVVADTVGVHPVHLARVFREKNGCTMGEYLRRLRLDFAAREITNTNSLLGEIAITAGFADQSHLTKTFKTYFGLTPSEFRRLHKS